MTFFWIISLRAAVAFSSSILQAERACASASARAVLHAARAGPDEGDAPVRLMPVRGLDQAVQALGLGELLRVLLELVAERLLVEEQPVVACGGRRKDVSGGTLESLRARGCSPAHWKEGGREEGRERREGGRGSVASACARCMTAGGRDTCMVECVLHLSAREEGRG